MSWRRQACNMQHRCSACSCRPLQAAGRASHATPRLPWPPLLTICSLMTLPSSSTVRIFCSGAKQWQRLGASTRASQWLPEKASALFRSPHMGAPPALPLPAPTHKVDANGGDVALRVCVVLHAARHAGCGLGSSRRGGPAPNADGASARTGGRRRLTANRSSRHDLPTPESPISRSCAGGQRGEGVRPGGGRPAVLLGSSRAAPAASHLEQEVILALVRHPGGAAGWEAACAARGSLLELAGLPGAAGAGTGARSGSAGWADWRQGGQGPLPFSWRIGAPMPSAAGLPRQ